MKQLIFTLMLVSAFFTQAQVGTTDTITKSDSVFTVELEDVVITATRNLQRLSKGGLITDIKGTSLSELGTCADIIAQLPGVIANEGNFEIVGRGTPQIYINGRKLIDRSELDRLSSKEIQNVEVVFNPGVKYGAETKAVILIKTVKKQGEGLSGSVSISGRQAHFLSQSDNLFLNFRIGGLDIFGTFNYDFTQRYQKQHDLTRIRTLKDSYIIDSDILIYPKWDTYLTGIGANWQINNNHYMGVKYDYSATPDSRSKWLTSKTVTGNHVEEDKIFYDTDWKGKSTPVHLVNLYYQGKVNSFDISINNDYYHRNHHDHQTILENSMLDGKRIIGSVNRVVSSMFASKGVAEYSLGGNTLEFGYEVTATDRKDIFVNIGDNLPDADDRIKETTGAGLIAVNIPVRNVEIYAGLRYEHTSSVYRQNGILVKGQSRRYGRVYPNLDFTFPIDKAKFTLSYEAKTKRPLYSQLSSSIQYDDRFTYETGNPLLTSERIHNVSLAGIYKWIFFSARYTYDKDAIISVIRPYAQDAPQNLMTYENFHHLSTYDIVVSFSPRISRWSPRLRLNLSGQKFSFETTNGIKRMNSPILFYNFFNNVSLEKGFNVTGEISGRSSGDMDVVALRPSWQINIGLSKNSKNWFFQLQATDILKTARGSMITYGTQMTLDKWNYSDTQALRLIIRYSFNAAMSKYKGKGAGVSERNRII
ncbi:MAG: outer membrane beta-barrel protein [Muribaculaceae bacterium]|nr:outer membrane beta-barrel protein [Muribaculaceae bacterium]